VHKNRHTFRVIYGDTDKMGVVYYANYLRFFEAGRNELLRALGVNYRELEETGFMLPVAQASVKYKAPARYDDELALDTIIADVGHGIVRITYELFRLPDGLLLTTGETTHACLGPSGRPTRLPEALKARLVDRAAP
jgi:acyl-CoA thioester hydrolase